jgi:hypothetical protein
MVTQIVLAKDLTLQSDALRTHAKAFQEAIRASGGLNLGIFRLSASYSSDKRENSTQVNFDSGTVTSPGPQIIAVISNFVDRSPNPKTGVTFSDPKIALGNAKK